MMVMSKILLQQNKANDAATFLEDRGAAESNSAVANLLSAQVHLKLKDNKMAEQCLEQALSIDFGIRAHPIFCLVKSTICMSKVRFEKNEQTSFHSHMIGNNKIKTLCPLFNII